MKFSGELLDHALRSVDLPDHYGVVLEGSIAEGFGNKTSDVDYLVVTDEDHEFPTMPTVLFIGGHRVEVRFRSMRQLVSQAEQITRLSGETRNPDVATLDDLLNRYQRFSRAVVVRNASLVAGIRAAVPALDLRYAVSEFFRRQSCATARYALALLVLGQHDQARLTARSALIQAAKSWAAENGETYLAVKWISEQLARIRGHDELIAAFWSLASSRPVSSGTHRYVEDCLRTIARFGVAGASFDLDRVSIGRIRGVTTWQIGRQVHVVSKRRDVFALSAAAARTWRSLVFGVPLRRALEASPTGMSGRLVAQFYHLGLVELRWREGSAAGRSRRISVKGNYRPGPLQASPSLSNHGLNLTGTTDEICLSPLSAEQFAAAGMAKVWADVEIENAREDMVGALDRGQWGVARIAARRMLRRACHVALIAFGVYPSPADNAPYQLHLVEELSGKLSELAAAIDHEIDAADFNARLDSRVLGRLEDFVNTVRKSTNGDDFPSSFEDGNGWQKTLEIGYDWVRLGAYLDSDFPIEEARDLIRSGGRQPHSAIGTPAIT